ncbi:Hypothetical protein R9X50_00017900 [Acrodontium crateriforme]|uniref:Suppressor of anucleate metulae protein B n=1 Tax=Acrodontium crateriforme TaxID=150365 RepID=A0AAQ3R6X0_9PEZI|nr:Hypothetical protein R9X50_00017900 [Acrodontium crateriforme]
MSYSGHVELKSSKITDAGNGVFASKDFAPGDIIISLPRPLVAELENQHLASSCSWCFSHKVAGPTDLPTDSLDIKACTGCRKIKYCSRQCQTKHWKLDHKYDCKVLSDPQRPPLPYGVRATIKLLKRLQLGDAEVRKVLDFQPKIEHLRKYEPSILEDSALMAMGAWKFAGEPRGTNVDLAQTLFLNVMCNTLDLSNALSNMTLGAGFDPILCSINHSCQPNTMLIFNNPHTMVRAIRPISRGEEIFIQYRDPSNPFTVRQAELEEKYFFKCNCSKCEKGSTLQEDTFKKPSENLSSEWCRCADELIARHASTGVDVSRYQIGSSLADRRVSALQAEAFRLSGTHGSGIMESEKALRICLESDMWTLTRQPVPYLLGSFFDNHIGQGPDGLEKALHVGLVKYFILNPALAPQPFDNSRIIDTITLAKVAISWSRSASESSIVQLRQKGCDVGIFIYGLLNEAWAAVPLSFGRNSQFGQAVEMIWKQINEDGQLHDVKMEMVKRTWPVIKAYAETINVLDCL